MFTVTDIKKFIYCQREIYYQYVMPIDTVESAKMSYGNELHTITEILEKRRVIKKYGLSKGEKLFKKNLISEKYGFYGIADMIIKKGNQYYPVEYKFMQNEPFDNYKFQLAAYSLAIEEMYVAESNIGFIHAVTTNKIYEVDLEIYKNKIINILSEMKNIVEKEMYPKGANSTKKCRDCEYRLFCNDR